MVFWPHRKANTLAGTEGGPRGLPSKHRVGKANTRGCRASRCALWKCARAARVEKSEGQLTEPAGLRGGHGDAGPAAEPRVTDRFISLASPALRCNQARNNVELSICYPRRQGEGGSWGTERKGGGRGCAWEAEPSKDWGARPRWIGRPVPSATQPGRGHALTQARSRCASSRPPEHLKVMVSWKEQQTWRQPPWSCL